MGPLLAGHVRPCLPGVPLRRPWRSIAYSLLGDLITELQPSCRSLAHSDCSSYACSPPTLCRPASGECCPFFCSVVSAPPVCDFTRTHDRSRSTPARPHDTPCSERRTSARMPALPLTDVAEAR